jgi:UDP-N-acetylglucosamine:LPS N-acetylglucosamine transferase/UDP-2,3-diacylglucosamine pyrophosphatase LpxH
MSRPSGSRRQTPEEIVPDLVTVRVPCGGRLLVVGDLHLGAARTAASRWATHELERRLRVWQGPGAVLLAGDVFELLGPDEAHGVASALGSHASFVAALRRFAGDADRSVVCLAGNHDGRLAWDDESASAVRDAIGCQLALAARVEMTTVAGTRTILVEHGHQLDPANAFVDPRSPDDTPLGHHVVRELLPALEASPGSWLADADGLADPLAFPDFVASRLVYRRMLRRPWWLAVLLAVIVLLRVPLTYRLLTDLRHPLTTAALTRRVLLMAVVVLGDLVLMGALVLVGARRVWKTAGERMVGRRGPAQNEAPRERARELVAQGYAGLVTGHTHHAELTAVGQGFYANVGSGTEVVTQRRARAGLPPVYLPELQLSWIEIETEEGLHVRLFDAGRDLRAGTWLERHSSRRGVTRPWHPAVAAEFLEPPSHMPTRAGLPEAEIAGETGRRRTMRVLIVSATVGEGHNAAARGLAEDLLRTYPDAEVTIENGLVAVSPLLERFIVDSYRFQLRRAPWSYEWLYTAIVRSPRFARFLYALCGIVGGRRMQRLVENEDPDIVISTYPLTSAMLAWLRERGRVRVPCANIITDLAPHPMWIFDGLDVNFVMHPETVAMVHTMIGTPPLEVVAPPVSVRFHAPARRAEARQALGLPFDAFVALVVGGGWGVGELRTTAWAASTSEDVWTVVVCGRNESLRAALEAERPPRSVVLGFVDNMPELMDAADVMIHNAGGLTCLEAFVRGCPVIVTEPIPGHGIACAELMEGIGAIRYVREPGDLAAVLGSCVHDDGLRARATGLQAQLMASPAASSRLASLLEHAGAEPAPAGTEPSPVLSFPVARRRRRVRLVASMAAAVATVGFLTSDMPVSLAAGPIALPAVRSERRSDDPHIGLSIVSSDQQVLTRAAGLVSAGGGRATFFAPGMMLSGRPPWIATLEAAGELGNGGSGLPIRRLSGFRRIERDTSAGRNEIEGASGHDPAFYLPVGGTLTPAAYVAASREHELPVVGSRRVRTAADAQRPLRDGDVVVVDVRRAAPPQATDLVDVLLHQAQAQHLRVVDLSQAHPRRAP